jgi:pullulanase/glycogen debranching enzyme
MYEQFGAREVGDTRTARFRLFIPDNTLDPNQYTSGGSPNIAAVHVIGDFQSDLGKTDWTVDPVFELKKTKYTDPADGKTKGWLYELVTEALPEGFYQYKFHITYLSGGKRVVCDPCTRYGGATNQNSAVVIGGPKMDVPRLASPRPLDQLVLYELMIDDFTASILGNKARLAVVRDRIDYLADLGVTAVGFMPWTQWPGEQYNWGYEPQDYFAVAFRYTLNPADETEKLFLLKEVIARCHERGIHVFLDGVFNQVSNNGPDDGFGYHWIWENPDDSPYTGIFEGHDYGLDLDYGNDCLAQFIFDVCRYWIEEFAIDGIRFDYTLGFYAPADPEKHGLTTLVNRLGTWLGEKQIKSFPLIIEHWWDYGAIDVVNKVGVTSCWLDPFRSQARTFLSNRQIQPSIMRMLDSARDFDTGRIPVTYIENHDHESLALNAGSRGEWWRMQPYAIALMTVAGAPLIHNGQEFAELYPMPEPFHEDPTAPPDSQDPARKRVVPRPLHWSYQTDGSGAALLDLYRRLIDIRQKHPGLTSANFHPRGWDESWTKRDGFGFGIDVEHQVVVYHRWGKRADGKMEKFYIVLNFSGYPQAVDLSFPDDEGWTDLLSGWTPPVHNNWLHVVVGSNWGHIFYKLY